MGTWRDQVQSLTLQMREKKKQNNGGPGTGVALEAEIPTFNHGSRPASRDRHLEGALPPTVILQVPSQDSELGVGVALNLCMPLTPGLSPQETPLSGV